MLAYVLTLFIYFANFSINADQTLSAQELWYQSKNLIKNSALNANRIDWPAVDNAAVTKKSMDDLQPFIDNLIAQLGDGHSKFKIVSAVTTVTRKLLNDRPQGRFIAGQVAYLKIPPYNGNVSEQHYVQQLSTLVMRMHKKHPIGWIIDLRDYNDQTPWRLLAGLDAFIKSPTVGYVTYADRQTEPIIMTHQNITSNRGVLLNSTINHRYYKIDEIPMVALVVDQNTSHAGLTVAALMKHHIQAQVFSSAIDEQDCLFMLSHQLTDQACLHLVEGKLLDARQQPLIFRVDKITKQSEHKTDDALIIVIDWMLTTIEQQIEKAEPDPFKD